MGNDASKGVSSPDDLRIRTKEFALRIIKLFRALPRTEEARVLGRQILRSGTAVAANYRSACRGRSRADFISKIGITVEEADETAFWLELLIDAGIVKKVRLEKLLVEANELVRIFQATRTTAKVRIQSQITNRQSQMV
ncbi:MAG: four helix bundle protein [Acidobacteriota bacterium]|nr:four helix bundle protein [Acidobacteriota bacterium]